MHQLYIRAVNGPHNEVTKISFWNSSGHIMGKVVYTTETAKDIDVEELYMLTAGDMANEIINYFDEDIDEKCKVSVQFGGDKRIFKSIRRTKKFIEKICASLNIANLDEYV